MAIPLFYSGNVVNDIACRIIQKMNTLSMSYFGIWPVQIQTNWLWQTGKKLPISRSMSQKFTKKSSLWINRKWSPQVEVNGPVSESHQPVNRGKRDPAYFAKFFKGNLVSDNHAARFIEARLSTIKLIKRAIPERPGNQWNVISAKSRPILPRITIVLCILTYYMNKFFR